MSWNIQKPGDYLNGPLTVMGNVGIGTTTFTSIAGYTSLKINNATNGAILDLAQGDAYKGRVIGSLNGLVLESAAGLPVQIQVGGLNSFKLDPAGIYTWYDGAGGTNQRMQLNSTGLGIGASPLARLHSSNGSSSDSGLFTGLMIGGTGAASARTASLIKNTSSPYDLIIRTQDFTSGTTGSLIVQNGSTEVFRVNTNGAAVLSGGNVSASGVGIAFPAAQSASTDANTLDDYEEGTWTPVFADASTGGNTATAASAVGIYTKTGNIVTVQYQIESINTTGLTAGNVVYIRGLPFSVTATPASPGHVMTGNVAFGGFLSSNCVNGGTQILFYDCLTGGALSTRVVSNFTSGTSSIYGSFSYRVA